MNIAYISSWSDYSMARGLDPCPIRLGILNNLMRKGHNVIAFMPTMSSDPHRVTSIPNDDEWYYGIRTYRYNFKMDNHVDTIIDLVESTEIKFDLFYGDGCYAGLPVSELGMIYDKPTVMKFYGTFLGNRLDQLEDLVGTCEMNAYTSPLSLIIMKNDGTYGDKVLDKLGIKNYVFNPQGVGDFFVPDGREETRKKLGFSDNIKYLLCVSRLNGWKRVNLSIQSMRHINNPDIRLNIIGDGEETERLKDLAKDDTRIKFLGNQSKSVVADYMRSSDILLSFYDFSNGGLPLFEAQRSGLPVITCNTGNTKSFIQDGINGFILDTNPQPLEIANKIEYLLHDTILYEEIKKGSIQYGSQVLTEQENIANCVNLITDLL